MSQSNPLSGVDLRPGATESQIVAAGSDLRCHLPDDYKEVLRRSNGVEGPLGDHAYLALWSTDELASLNSDYAVKEFLPGVVVLGTDGGNTGYGFQERDGGVHYLRVPLVGMSPEEIEELGGRFSELVEVVRAG